MDFYHLEQIKLRLILAIKIIIKSSLLFHGMKLDYLILIIKFSLG